MSQIIQNAIAQRELGALGLSIATDLAIAGAFGEHPDRPLPNAPILAYKQLLVNIRTLVRNFLGCIQKERKVLLTPDYTTEALLYEMSAIQEIITSKSKGKITVGFYCSRYEKMRQEFPNANLKEPKTHIQIVNEGLENALVKGLITKLQTNKEFPFGIVEMYLDRVYSEPTVILTHIPMDLLARNKFEKLALLESHTGRIKNHLEWNTRLTNGKELPNIPFNKFTLQVFGDNGLYFSPMERKVKNAVIDIAEKRKWSVTTTDDRIRYSLEQIDDLDIKKTLLQLL